MPLPSTALPSLTARRTAWCGVERIGALLAAPAASRPALAPWQVHDYANLGVLPALVALTAVALWRSQERWYRALAQCMLVYVAVDSVWIAAVPSIVKGPYAVLVHHVATLALLWHPLTHRAHLRYVAWMTVVELNTWLLIARRHFKRFWLEGMFTATWVAGRMVWFPYAAVHMSFFSAGWPTGAPGARRRALVSACTFTLTLLQLRWSWQILGRRR